MEYNIKVNDQDRQVQFDTDDDNENEIFAEINGEKIRAAYHLISTNRIHMSLEKGQSFREVDVHLARDGGSLLVGIGGIRYCLQDKDKCDSRGPRAKDQALPDLITPPMPSIVISILVHKGDEVEKGSPVIVLSAMKMETTLVAPFSGKVARVNVGEGDKVAPGDLLVDIEKSNKADDDKGGEENV